MLPAPVGTSSIATSATPGLTPIDWQGHRAAIYYPSQLMLPRNESPLPDPCVTAGQQISPERVPQLATARPAIPAAICPMQATVNLNSPANHFLLTPTGPLPPLPQPAHIKPDGSPNHTGKSITDICKLRQIHRNDLCRWMLSRGIDADRLTCPSLSTQFAIAETAPIQSILCSCISGDGRPSVSDALAKLFPAEILAGCLLLSVSLGLPATIAVDSARQPNTLMQLAKGTACRIASTSPTYPAADPHLLTLSLTSRRLRPGSSPAAAGLIFLDAAAAYDLGRCVLNLEPALVPTVAYLADAAPQLIFAPRATPIHDFAATLPTHACRDADRIFLDDLPRNLHPTATQTIDTASRTLHIRPPTLQRPPQPCVRCGWCADVCPTRLRPALLLDAVQHLPTTPVRATETAAAAGLHACIECGLCNYICPSALDLLAAVRDLRQPSTPSS